MAVICGGAAGVLTPPVTTGALFTLPATETFGVILVLVTVGFAVCRLALVLPGALALGELWFTALYPEETRRLDALGAPLPCACFMLTVGVVGVEDAPVFDCAPLDVSEKECVVFSRPSTMSIDCS